MWIRGSKFEVRFGATLRHARMRAMFRSATTASGLAITAPCPSKGIDPRAFFFGERLARAALRQQFVERILRLLGSFTCIRGLRCKHLFGTFIWHIAILSPKFASHQRAFGKARVSLLSSDKIDKCRVLRDVIPPTPPGPEGSNGNGLMRVQ
jgi:hypothetical protein